MTTLEDAGVALFGNDWMAATARELEINLRTVRRMYTGESRVPPGIKLELAALLRAEARRLEQMAADLETDAQTNT